MANLKPAIPVENLKEKGIAATRNEYTKVSTIYNKMLGFEILLCNKCGSWAPSYMFYHDNRYASLCFPTCKKCIQKIVEQKENDRDAPNETKKSVQKALRLMDKVYDEPFYDNCVKGSIENIREKGKTSPFSIYITSIQSLPNWRGKTWKDSVFINDVEQENIEINENSRKLKSAKKRFGNYYSNSDLIFLENEYIDWTERYACENKAQELLFKRVCFKELEIDKAQREGKDTKELDKSLQELLTSLSVKPSQNSSNALTESKTFGQLIQKWEMEKPIPEPENEFKDVDKIGLYIDVFFKGHLSKMMGLKNGFSSLYDKFISKYTVTKPQYDEDSDSEILFEQVFGSKIEEE